MADELNGRDGHEAGPEAGPGAEPGPRRGTRAFRVAFAPATPPALLGAGAVLVEIGPAHEVAIDGKRVAATLSDLDPPRALLRDGEGAGAGERERTTHHVLISELANQAWAAAGGRRLEVVVDGWRFEFDIETERRARLRERATNARADAAKGGPSELRAIIPGRVVSVDVAEGDTVESGRRLLVLEAMKMQNELRAPRAGTVARIAIGPGQTVELGDLLLVIE